MGNTVTVDQKGRLKIPANLLVSLQESDAEFYATSECGDSIRIYPMKVWNQVEERLEHLCSRNRNYQKFLARAKYFGQAVSIDRQGRMLIPIALRRSAQIKGAVDVFDYMNHLEVWNHARFLKSLKSNPITEQDENMLSRQLSTVARFPQPSRSKKRKKHTHGKMREAGRDRHPRGHSHGQVVHAIRTARPDAPEHARVA
jgi:MraZ protein